FTVQALSIISLTPSNGLDGTSVVIAGNGFDPSLTGNTVLFNGLPATVTAVTPTQLTVTAPTGFTTGAVTIQADWLAATGPVFSRAGVQTIYQNLNVSFNGLAVDAAGNIYVTERASSGSTNNIFKMAPDGSNLTVFAGSPAGVAGSDNGNGTAASFNNPGVMAF